MKKWLHEITQMKIDIIQDVEMNHLPFVYREKFEFSYLLMDEFELLLVQPKSDRFSVESIIKEMGKVRSITNKDPVLWFDTASHYQRKMLLKNRIPFIVNNNSFFLPSLGLYLNQRIQQEKKESHETFTPQTQLVFIYVILNVENQISITELSTQLHIEKMAVSRAFRDLSARNLFEVKTVGRKKILAYKEAKSAVVMNAMKYLHCPIQKTIYLEDEDFIEGTRIAGTRALEATTNLNESKNIRAIDHRQLNKNSLNQREKFTNTHYPTSNVLEVWKYDPCRLSKDEYVDVISLYLSLKSNQDERVQGELDTRWKEFLWSLDLQNSLRNSKN